MTEHKDVFSAPIPVMFDCFRVHRLTRATTGNLNIYIVSTKFTKTQSLSYLASIFQSSCYKTDTTV